VLGHGERRGDLGIGLAARDEAQHLALPCGQLIELRHSLGDEIVLSSTARHAGRVAGRTEAVCVIQDATYQAFSCTGSLILGDGVISFAGSAINRKLPDIGRTALGGGEHYAITGGTGAYAGAGGEVRLHGPEKAERADITFAG
jgi:hypothetical protein